jgi:hypothetical protein
MNVPTRWPPALFQDSDLLIFQALINQLITIFLDNMVNCGKTVIANDVKKALLHRVTTGEWI